jgi:hypothetical protein
LLHQKTIEWQALPVLENDSEQYLNQFIDQYRRETPHFYGCLVRMPASLTIRSSAMTSHASNQPSVIIVAGDDLPIIDALLAWTDAAPVVVTICRLPGTYFAHQRLTAFYASRKCCLVVIQTVRKRHQQERKK